MATQANATAETMNRDFSSIATHASTMAERITTATHAFHFGDMMDAGMQLQQTGEHMLGFFESAVEAGAEFDQSIKNATSSLNANLEKTKLSKAQIEAMGNAALQMGSDGFFSANQIAEAMNTMAKQGLTYQDIMSGGIQVVKNVAAANQQDLEETANVVSDIYNEMGEEFKKAGKTSQEASQEIGNSMTVALHHARISMGDFLQTMKYVGPQASAVGVSIQDVSAAIAVLGQHGIRGSQAGTTLRRMLTNLTPASKEAGAMMRQLGMITKDGGNVFYDAHGKMKSFTDVQKILHDKLGGLTPQMQQFAIKTIFGQYALSGMTAIVNTSNDKFQTLTREMGNNNIMTDIMNTKSQGLAMQIQKLKAHFETLQKEIGLMLRPVLAVIIVLAEKLMNAWEHLSHPVKQAIVIFGAIASVLLVVGGTVLTMLGLFGMFITSAGAAVAGISRLLGVLRLMSPPVLAVIAVIAALKYAWDHDIGGIREITSKFLNWFKPIFGHTFNQAKKDVMDALHTITKGFTGWNKDVMGPINKTVNSILHAFVDGLKTVVKAVSTGITTVTGWFKKMAPDINKAMHNIVAFFTKHSAVWNALWVAFKFVVKFAWDFIIGIIKHAWGLFSGIIQLFVHIINGQWKKVFQDLWQIVKNAFLLALDLMGGFVGKAFGWFGRFLAHTNIFGKSFSKILSWAFTHMGQIADKAWKYVEKIFNGAIKVIESLVRPLSKFIQAMFKGIAKFISEHSGAAMNFLKKAFQVGLNVAKTLLKDCGLRSKTS
jgi:TP901 family phage tail tape measure protein